MFKEGKKRESADKSKFSLIKLFSCVEKKTKKKERKVEQDMIVYFTLLNVIT